MSIDEIIKYVMETPENTNPNVLRSLLESYGGSSEGTESSEASKYLNGLIITLSTVPSHATYNITNMNAYWGIPKVGQSNKHFDEWTNGEEIFEIFDEIYSKACDRSVIFYMGSGLQLTELKLLVYITGTNEKIYYFNYEGSSYQLNSDGTISERIFDIPT